MSCDGSGAIPYRDAYASCSGCAACRLRQEVDRLESELKTARERIAELEYDLHTERNANEYQRACRKELESRNAAEKAAAELQTLMHYYAMDPGPRERFMKARIDSLRAALAPAPDAKVQRAELCP